MVTSTRIPDLDNANVGSRSLLNGISEWYIPFILFKKGEKNEQT